MPCYEGPRPEDTERQRLMAGAFPALLCGMFDGWEFARDHAKRWCEAHKLVDGERAARPYSSRAYDLQRACDDILIEFNLLRGAVERCKHPRGEFGYCPDCGARASNR